MNIYTDMKRHEELSKEIEELKGDFIIREGINFDDAKYIIFPKNMSKYISEEEMYIFSLLISKAERVYQNTVRGKD